MDQSRKKFIKHLLIGAASVPLFIEACKKDSTAKTISGSSAQIVVLQFLRKLQGRIPMISAVTPLYSERTLLKAKPAYRLV